MTSTCRLSWDEFRELPPGARVVDGIGNIWARDLDHLDGYHGLWRREAWPEFRRPAWELFKFCDPISAVAS